MNRAVRIIGSTLLAGSIIVLFWYMIIRKLILSPSDRIIQQVRSKRTPNGKQKYSDQLAKLILSVSQHETANLTSELTKQNNNYFGMGINPRSPFQNGSNANFAKYDSLENSVDDFINWFSMVSLDLYHCQDVSSIVKAMQSKGYFIDTYENYYKGVNFFYNKP